MDRTFGSVSDISLFFLIGIFIFIISIYIQCDECNKKASQDDLDRQKRDAFARATIEWAKKRYEYKEADRKLSETLAVLDVVVKAEKKWFSSLCGICTLFDHFIGLKKCFLIPTFCTNINNQSFNKTFEFFAHRKSFVFSVKL